MDLEKITMESPEVKSIMEIILLDTFHVATCCTKEHIQRRTVAALLRWLQTPAFPSLPPSPSFSLSPFCPFILPLPFLSLY